VIGRCVFVESYECYMHDLLIVDQRVDKESGPNTHSGTGLHQGGNGTSIKLIGKDLKKTILVCLENVIRKNDKFLRIERTIAIKINRDGRSIDDFHFPGPRCRGWRKSIHARNDAITHQWQTRGRASSHRRQTA